MSAMLKIDEAAVLTGWAVETLGSAVGVEADGLAIHQRGREVFGGRAEVSEELLAHALIAAAGASTLHLQPALVDASTLAATPLPVLTCGGGGAAVTQRRGDEVLVLRPRHEPEWMKPSRLFAALGDLPHAWVTAVPAAPLTAVGAGDGPHPPPGRRLWALLHLERDDLQLIVIYAAVVGLLSLATPIAVQALVSTVAFGTLLQPIVVLSLMLLAALGFQKTLVALQTRVVESIQQRLFVRTAADLSWRLPRVKQEAADHGFGPESVNRFFEVLTLQKTAGTLLTDGIATALQIGIGLMVLAFYHPALLAFDLVLVALLLLVVFVPARRGLKTSLEESYAKYEVAAWLEQLARPGGALRGPGVAFAAERADALTGRYLAARRKHFQVMFGQTVGALGLQVLASAGLLGLGGWLVLQQALTLGQLVAAELIVAAVASSIGKLGKLLDATYDLLTALDKLGHLVDLPLEKSEHGEPVPGQGGVRLEVHAAASDEASAPLHLEVPAGSRLALVGAEGHPVGEWLAGLRIPSRGAVSLNGVETSRARTPSLREHIAFVQRGDFFEGTVLENLTLGRVGVTTGEARAALERVGLLDELRGLPDGLDTHLSHNGAPLTHSQLTRLLVARALTGAPRLIVVDESLESIEPAARARCVAALTRPGAPWTLVALVADQSVALARGCARAVTLAELTQEARS